MAFLDETGLAELWDVFKEHSLTDKNKALFGMGVSATPDDVFAFLGKYNQHWWKITNTTVTSGYNEVRTAITESVAVTGSTYDETNGPSEVAHTIKYATSVNINQSNGTITLVNPQSLEMSVSNVDALVSLAPVYVTNLYGNTSGIYYIPAGATGGFDPMSGGCTVDAVVYVTLNPDAPIPAQLISSAYWSNTTGSVDYVYSSNRNAYPDSGTSGTLTYEYMGVPFDNIQAAPRIATGSYAGTGAYGSNNAVKVVLPFKPRAFFSGVDTAPIASAIGMRWLGQETLTTASVVVTVSDNIISMYTTDSNFVNYYNKSGTTYYWVALG